LQGAGFGGDRGRIATFDNDGTLWVEQPLPAQPNAPKRASWTAPDLFLLGTSRSTDGRLRTSRLPHRVV
jgi:hypothetical protein